MWPLVECVGDNCVGLEKTICARYVPMCSTQENKQLRINNSERSMRIRPVRWGLIKPNSTSCLVMLPEYEESAAFLFLVDAAGVGATGCSAFAPAGTGVGDVVG